MFLKTFFLPFLSLDREKQKALSLLFGLLKSHSEYDVKLTIKA